MSPAPTGHRVTAAPPLCPPGLPGLREEWGLCPGEDGGDPRCPGPPQVSLRPRQQEGEGGLLTAAGRASAGPRVSDQPPQPTLPIPRDPRCPFPGTRTALDARTQTLAGTWAPLPFVESYLPWPPKMQTEGVERGPRRPILWSLTEGGSRVHPHPPHKRHPQCLGLRDQPVALESF